MNNNDENNEFLNEIQQKINKRSRGLYYNKKLKVIKKNLTVTSLVVIIIIILWALVNFIYQRVSLNTKVINKSPTHSKLSTPHNRGEAPPRSKTVILPDTKQVNKSPNSTISKDKLITYPITNGEKTIKKQKYRYIFTSKNKIKIKNSKLIKKILKKYSKTEGKAFYIYLIPETEIKNILKLLLDMNLKLKKESYFDITNYYQISINKEILDIINEK